MPKGSPELTSARKEEIINACLNLYQTMSFKEITIKDFGDATSFTRTSIYNYFHTKEEIFLAILQREYQKWVEELSLLEEEDAPSEEKLAKGIAETLDKRSLMLKILSMNHYDMEENSRQENLDEFKITYGKTLSKVDDLLKLYCPQKTSEQRQNFIYALFPFLYGIYPYTYVTQKQKKAMEYAELDFRYHSIYELTFSFIKQLLEV